MDTVCNFPPKEILKPIFGKPDYELIVLWMLSNNEVCSWSNLKKVIKPSTLSIYLNKLKSRRYLIKSEFNQYRITSKGNERFYRLSQAKRDGRKLSYPPNMLLRKRNYDHWILWMVYNNNYCNWADFLKPPLSINQSSLSKNLNELIDNGRIRKENKEYRITQAGKLEYSNMLKLYNLDRQSILEEESKRIEEITNETIKFFEKHKITDNFLQFRFLNNVLKLNYEKIKSVLKSEEEFYKILLFLAINHPSQYPEFISPDEFSKKYEIKQITLDYYIDEIVENQIYPVKFFKLEVSPEKYYYFQSNEKIEMMLRVITEEHITKLTYLKKLFDKTETLIASYNMSSTINAIVEEACNNIFNIGLKNSLREFLPEYISYLAYKIEAERKLKTTFDKLEGIIWQNILGMLKTDISDNVQFDFAGQSEMNYYIDPTILEIFEPFLEFKYDSNYKKVQLSLNKKDYSKALEIIDSIINLGKKDLNIIILKGIILCHLNRNKDSIEFLKKETDSSLITEKNQIYTSYFFALAFSNMTLGNFENALEIVNKSLEIYPNHPISHILKGLVLGYNSIYKFDPKKAEIENGLIDIDKAITLETHDDNKARYYQLKSQILQELGNYEAAVESINNAINLNPSELDFYNSKNRILIYFDQYNEVINLLDKMLEEFPEDEKNIKIKKAYALKGKQKIRAGLEIINELIEKYPMDNNLLLNKAYWLQHLDRKEAALNVMQSLIEQNPENGLYHDTFGEILMNFEEYDKAINEFLTTIEIGSNNWYIYQTYIKLGICYKELKDFNSASENLNKGKELTNKFLIDIDTKRKWLTIAELFLAEIEHLENKF
ncbi:MAG: hypothetical protein ACFE75_03770 [Candidatus Hodarchaeota archaeon]